MTTNDTAELDVLIVEAVRFMAKLLVEVLQFLMAHPTHLCVVTCVFFACLALVTVTAHARLTAVELKTLEEQREAREIDADRDVRVEQSRAQARVAAARLRVAERPLRVAPEEVDDESQNEGIEGRFEGERWGIVDIVVADATPVDYC